MLQHPFQRLRDGLLPRIMNTEAQFPTPHPRGFHRIVLSVSDNFPAETLRA
jgi:hypothetical protein